MERREEGKEKKGSRRPLGLTIDGDLLRLIRNAIDRPVYDIVRAVNVKGHAADDVVQHGKVRSADKAADCVPRRKADSVSSARAALVRESMISFDWLSSSTFLAISGSVANFMVRRGSLHARKRRRWASRCRL